MKYVNEDSNHSQHKSNSSVNSSQNSNSGGLNSPPQFQGSLGDENSNMSQGSLEYSNNPLNMGFIADPASFFTDYNGPLTSQSFSSYTSAPSSHLSHLENSFSNGSFQNYEDYQNWEQNRNKNWEEVWKSNIEKGKKAQTKGKIKKAKKADFTKKNNPQKNQEQICFTPSMFSKEMRP